MERFREEELQEALESIASAIHKYEQALSKLKVGTEQHTLLIRRINAFYIASALIEREMDQ